MGRIGLLLLVPVALLSADGFEVALQEFPQEQSARRIQAEFSDSGVARINAVLADGTPVGIVVKRTRYAPESFPYTTSYPNTEWSGWGARRGSPNTVITAVDVTAGERNVEVSMSAFSDLANPNRVLFEDTTPAYYYRFAGTEHRFVDHAAFRLIVWGSDASTAYTAELTFNTLFLERRAVRAGEFPMEEREETVYTKATLASAARRR